jgi:hypothetical protein
MQIVTRLRGVGRQSKMGCEGGSSGLVDSAERFGHHVGRGLSPGPKLKGEARLLEQHPEAIGRTPAMAARGAYERRG